MCRICVIGHSMVALRQQLFFKEVARQDHDVLVIAPGQWHDLRTLNEQEVFETGGSYRLVTCRHTGGDGIYDYVFLGAKELIEAFKPDWLYVQAEPDSEMALKSLEYSAKKRALFTWENIRHRVKSLSIWDSQDLVICGNREAEELVKPYNKNTALLLQVGIDTDHFQARPDVPRSIRVSYIGRRAAEKGLPYLTQAYPTVCIAEWTEYRMLPWRYSEAEVVVAFSQDTARWREQAPNYVVLEALSCLCKAVTSDTAAMKFWLEGCPAVVIVEGHEQYDNQIKLDRVIRLNRGINQALDLKIGDEGRQWVVDRFSNPVVAKKLVEVFEKHG